MSSKDFFASSARNLSSGDGDFGAIIDVGDDDSEEDPESEPEDTGTGKNLRREAEAHEEESVDNVLAQSQIKRNGSFTLTSVKMEKFDGRILQLSWVTKVTLHGNGLRELPSAICTMTNVSILNVTSNKLTCLPPSIGKMAALAKLDLNHNELIALPDEFSMLVKLHTCILDFNKLTEFPPPLFRLTKLGSLSLVENVNIRSFAPIERLRSFAKLSLQIDNVPKLVEEWQAAEARYPNVTLEWHKVFPEKILDFLFIGSLRTAQEQRVYDDLQISRVLTCGIGMSVNLGKGMDQLILNLADTVDTNLSGHLQKGMDYIADAKAKDEKVLVHCFAGLSRSASLICAYLMREYRWTFQKSLEFVKAARPNACPNEGFVHQLQLFEKELGIS